MNRILRVHLLMAVVACITPWPSALAAEGDLISINVRDEELTSLLELLAVQNRLNIVAGDGVAGRVTISLFDVPIDAALAQILAVQGLGFVRDGEFIRILTLEQLDELARSRDVMTTRVFTLNHITAQEAQQLLASLISADGRLTFANTSAPSGGGSGQAVGGSDASGQRQSIVVSERASRLRVIEETLTELDRPPLQVLLEATVLSIDLGEDNRHGVDFNVLGGIDFNSVGSSSDLTGVGGYNIVGQALDDFLFSGQTFGFTTDPPNQGLSLGYVDNNVAVFVEALEESTNATIVSNPKVVAMNGHEAEIIVGGRLGYTTLTTTETSTLEEVQFLETGTQLVFRPQIGDDGWIRMDVHPQNSTGVVDPVSGIPSENTTEITTKVLMRDGQTLILGGLISESISITRSQIPYLGSLPFLGVLFGRTVETMSRKELVILLTPHILDPQQEELRAEEAERRWHAVRRSQWESLSVHLRPRLADFYRQDAEVLRAQGRLQDSLGHVERSLRLNPTSVPASLLRVELLQELVLDELPGSEEDQSLEVLRQWRQLDPDPGPEAE